MKIKVQILTNDGNEVGRTFYTPEDSSFITNIVYDKLLDLLVGDRLMVIL